ncbi:MAG: glutamate 5-kinase [Acutalibacteraceae bacterium]|nr:glutamate 5-kinase [Acutalibacteraceae bacterium]
MKQKRIVIKVGTSTLTYENGKLNLRRLQQLCKVISDLQNSGREIILVSSGAVGVGIGKLGMKEKPASTPKRQALAAVGQCELMFMYDKIFGEYNNTVAQVLLTRRVIDDPRLRTNALNTFEELINMCIIPIVNENDTVATEEIEGANFGDNDMLSALVANVVSADLLVIMTDIDGLYETNPRVDPYAKLLKRVPEITDEIKKMAGGTGSNRGTGGMATKIVAAELATQSGIECCILNGSNPELLYDLVDGHNPGTIFEAKK